MKTYIQSTYTDIHNSMIPKNKNLEIIQMSINWRMEKDGLFM